MAKSILLIEDDRFTCTLIDACVGGEYKVAVAEYGEDGLDAVRARSWDAILLDYILPEMNGLEVLRQIRAINARVPILFMTGHGSLNTAMEALSAGADDYITKPFDPELIRLRILRLTGDLESGKSKKPPPEENGSPARP